jgi:SAM-dependent methyltransferase
MILHQSVGAGVAQNAIVNYKFYVTKGICMLEHGKVTDNHASVVFSWDHETFEDLLRSCDHDDEVKITLKYLHDKNAKILEAGCGLGRVVKYLSDKGFKHVAGIEINKQSVDYLNALYPELAIITGNILSMPYPKASFDVILSYGVIEHFPAGPQQPLQAMYDALKPGGTGIITVPSFNLLRRLSYALSWLDPRKYNLIRKIFGKKSFVFNKKSQGYYIDPQIGDFYEYRFTKKQFESLCTQAGFEIIESKPIAHLDGLFHSFFRPLVAYKNYAFTLSTLGTVINALLTKIPFAHNHMHACVVRKNK